MNFLRKLLSRLFIRNHNGVLVHHLRLKWKQSGTISGNGFCRMGFGNYETSEFFETRGGSYFNNSGELVLSDGVTIGTGFRILNRGKIRIGSKTYINPNAIIRIENGLEIGSDCAISWGVTFMDHDTHNIEGKEGHAPIKIGNKVWIGANCTILKGVRLGDGCVVATGAVVSKSFPAGSLIGGVPARVLKENVHWEL